MESKHNATIHGIYSLPEAARLLRVSTAKVNNWANGYTYKRKDDRREKLPVLQTGRQHPRILDFRELFELMAVREFRKLGVTLEDIRVTAQHLAQKLGTDFPFATEEYFVNGQVLVVASGEGLISPSTGQLVLDRMQLIRPELDFENGTIARWHPKSGNGAVLVDPEHKYGDPILELYGIPTRTLFRLFLAEQDLKTVANYYEISIDQLRHAIEFEQSLADAA